MTRQRALLWLLAAVLLAGAGWWLFKHTEWYDEPVRGETSDEVKRDPYYAAKALLRRLGAKVETRTSLETLPPPGATLVLNSRYWGLFPQRIAQLRAFVEAGGHLVISAQLPDDAEAFMWVPVRSVEAPKESKSPEPPATQAQQKPAADDVDQDNDDEDDAEKAAQPAPAAASAAPPAKKRASLPQPTTDESCGTLEEPAQLRPAVSPLRKVFVCGIFPRARTLVTSVTPLWGLAWRDRLQVVAVPVGKGRVTVSGVAPPRADNATLFNAQHALLLIAKLNFKAGDTVWFVDEEARPPLSKLLFDHALIALWLSVLAVVVALWRFGSRFGPRVAIDLPSRRSMREQITGTAGFIAARGGAPLHRAQSKALERMAARQLPGFERLITASERAAAIAAATGLDAAALANAMTPVSERDGARSPRALAGALALLESARRSLATLSSPSTPPKAPR